MRPLESCPVCKGSVLRPFAMNPWSPRCLHFAQVRCHGCGLVAAQPQATEEEMDAYYSAIYYEQHTDEAEAHWRVNVRDYPLYELPLMERLWSAYPPPRGGTVAEIGCGHGSMVTVLKERGYQARGCDVSRSAVAFCRAKGLDVIEGKSFEDPALQGTFDVVTALQVIEHVPDPRAFVRSLVALAKPGGVIALATEGIWTSQYAFNRATAWATGGIAPYRSSTLHTFVFQERHLEQLLNEEGCDGVKATTFQRGAPGGNLHWRLYKQMFHTIDRLTGHGEYLMAVGRRAR
jgi:2-polyprenyl-3-methyl-5-hydroxy-6-metoxy-1,4-benzoquinol methylase